MGAREGAGLEGSNSVMRCLDPPASFWAADVSSKVLTGLGFDWDFDEGTEKESFIVSLLLSRIGSNREEEEEQQNDDRVEAIRVLLRSTMLLLLFTLPKYQNCSLVPGYSAPTNVLRI